MNELISPKYLMRLIELVDKAIWDEYKSYKNVRLYLKKWHQEDYYNNWENFRIEFKENGEIDLLQTLHNVEGELLLKIAIDMNVETPDFIPSIPVFKNSLKTNYKTAYATFVQAFKQAETDPSLAIGLANSALESIIKEILKDGRISSKVSGKETLYSLAQIILREFRLQNNELPKEIKTIGNQLTSICQSIESLRSEKTNFHGKTDNDYIINETIYSYFILNSVATVGLFFHNYYSTLHLNIAELTENLSDELPF
ncbi:MAG: abortive infection family protein [Hymenobacteraceae bacterium]|nr:abortive infection family protein [Hymenobacteraceae bacterium]MDX5443558.1 abortive infection family protein [Hymenobacteraceae bacterium]MDX5511516.1 abortive infection family protein [Hymenobacteraceae bacterium]